MHQGRSTLSRGTKKKTYRRPWKRRNSFSVIISDAGYPLSPDDSSRRRAIRSTESWLASRSLSSSPNVSGGKSNRVLIDFVCARWLKHQKSASVARRKTELPILQESTSDLGTEPSMGSQALAKTDVGMKTEYDHLLLEEAVFLELHRLEAEGDSKHQKSFRVAVEPLYAEEMDEDSKNLAFRKIYEEYFSRLGFEGALREIIAFFPMFEAHLDNFVLLKATKKKEERAELFVREDERNREATTRTAVIKILASRFPGPETFSEILLPELFHISDMLDPAFAYKPIPLAVNEDSGTQNLVRDRYHVLWNTYIEGRLGRTREGYEGSGSKTEYIFRRVFSTLDEETAAELHQRVLNSSILTHPELVAIATDPEGDKNASA